MEIYEALKQDHEELKASLNELLSLSDDDDYRFILIENIRVILIAHSRAEEAVFYNTLRAIKADKGVMVHGFKEHLEAETLLRTLQAMDKLDLNWKSIARKLQDVLIAHIQNEETEIFGEAKEALSRDEAVKMTKAFAELKSKVEKEGVVKNSMDMVINMMPPRIANSIRNFGSWA